MSTVTTTPNGFLAAYRSLASSQKSGKGAPPYSLFVNRPLGRVFAAAAFQVELHPNQVTALSAGFTFAGILAIATVTPSLGLGLAVALLLVIGYALDSADGQLARLQGGGSLTGEWLDHMIDSVKIGSLHLAVLVSAYRFTDLDPRWLLVPLLFSVVDGVHFFGMILNDLVAREQRALAGRPAGPLAPSSARRSLLKLSTDYGVLCLAFVLLGATGPFAIVYTVLTAAKLGYTVLAARKWFGDVRRLDAERQQSKQLVGAGR